MFPVKQKQTMELQGAMPVIPGPTHLRYKQTITQKPKGPPHSWGWARVMDGLTGEGVLGHLPLLPTTPNQHMR
jgi:hypothetical protein